jgi:hypothetical protein
MGIEALLSTQIIDTTTVGRAVMTAVDAAAARTALGLGTLSTQNGTITDYLTTAAAATTYQPLDADLTALAALTGTDNLYYRSGASTWSSVTIGTGLTFTGGTLAASSAGIGGSTGSTDNLILRSDGTGGATLQNSNWSVPDAYTASPNATVNHVSLQATGSTTNVSVSIVPKGTGSVSLQVPDGTSSGGNARGTRAVDLQTSRSSASQVAAGTDAFLSSSTSSTVGANTTRCAAIASLELNINNGDISAAVGAYGCTINSSQMVVLIAADSCTTNTVNCATAIASKYALVNRSMQITHASTRWAANGDLQAFRLTGNAKTTTNEAVEMNFGLGVGNIPIYLTVAAGYVVSGQLLIHGIKSDGTVTARYCRHFTIRRVASTTTLDDTATVGTDRASGTSLSLTADSTNHRLKIEPTGVSGETWRWQVVATCIEQTYGT